MRQWFNSLGVRERLLLSGTALLLVLAMVYGLAWRPFTERIDRLRATVDEQQAAYQWMQTAAGEARRLLGGPGPGDQGSGGRSLLSIVDQTARQGGLGPALRRVEPEGGDKVRIRIEEAGFDDLIQWLELLAREYGVRVESITVDGRVRPGVVDARLTLEGAAS